MEGGEVEEGGVERKEERKASRTPVLSSLVKVS